MELLLVLCHLLLLHCRQTPPPVLSGGLLTHQSDHSGAERRQSKGWRSWLRLREWEGPLPRKMVTVMTMASPRGSLSPAASEHFQSSTHWTLTGWRNVRARRLRSLFPARRRERQFSTAGATADDSLFRLEQVYFSRLGAFHLLTGFKNDQGKIIPQLGEQPLEPWCVRWP